MRLAKILSKGWLSTAVLSLYLNLNTAQAGSMLDLIYNNPEPNSSINWQNVSADILDTEAYHKQKPTILFMGDKISEAIFSGIITADLINSNWITIDASNPTLKLLDFTPNDIATQIQAFLQRQRAQLIIVSLGAGDLPEISNRIIRDDAFRHNWRVEFKEKIQATLNAIKASHIDIILVGLPPFANVQENKVAWEINQLYKEISKQTTIQFIDIWPLFSNDRGEYTTLGINENSAMTTMRDKTFLTFTNAGKIKLATYITNQIKQRMSRNLNAISTIKPKKEKPKFSSFINYLNSSGLWDTEEEQSNLVGKNRSRSAALSPKPQIAPFGRADNNFISKNATQIANQNIQSSESTHQKPEVIKAPISLSKHLAAIEEAKTQQATVAESKKAPPNRQQLPNNELQLQSETGLNNNETTISQQQADNPPPKVNTKARVEPTKNGLRKSTIDKYANMPVRGLY